MSETRAGPYQGNLFTRHPKEFTDTWEGCAHLDCIPGCSSAAGHCERLKLALERWELDKEE